MSTRQRLAVRAAALGAACFLVALLAPSAGATGAPLPNYTGSSIGQGVVTTFAVKPSIFDPLAQGGFGYSEATVSSQGGGEAHAVSSEIFPGSFVVGAVPCGVSNYGWTTGTYPPTTQADPSAGGCAAGNDFTGYQSSHVSFGTPADATLNTIIDHTNLTAYELHAHTCGQAVAPVCPSDIISSQANTGAADYTLTGDPVAPHVLDSGDFHVTSVAHVTGGQLENEVTVDAKDVSLLGGIVKIGSLRSRALSSSDGTVGTADASIVLGDVQVMVNGVLHEATIDNNGVHIQDPSLPQGQNAQLQQTFDLATNQLGIDIKLVSPSELVTGAAGDASIGGLLVSFSATAPVVQVPTEVARAVATVFNALNQTVPGGTTKCLTDVEQLLGPAGSSLPSLPLCFGLGALPGFGSQAVLTLTLGSAEAYSAGSLGYIPPAVGAGCGAACSGGGFTPPPFVQPPAVTPIAGNGSFGTAPPVQPQATGPLLGVYARMPSGVLMGIGVALLMLAVGAALGPSLRHARDS